MRNGNEVAKTRVTPEIKHALRNVAERELLSEAAWLKRLIVRELGARRAADGGTREAGPTIEVRQSSSSVNGTGARGKPLFVRLRRDDRLLLDARAEARGMRPATYASVLLRAHLRQLTPLPKEELLALKRSVAELAAIGRNINQIGKAANQGARLPSSAREDFRAMLKIWEALRDNTKALLKASELAWSAGNA
jgi:hypothetical protein